MARLISNAKRVLLDGVDVTGYLVEVSPEFSNDSTDVTAGDVAHEQVEPGLNKTSFSVQIGYEIGSVSAYIQKCRAGAKYVLEYGPEGNTAGKPKHVQPVKVDSVTQKQSAKKEFVIFNLKLTGTDAPTTDMMAGGVY